MAYKKIGGGSSLGSSSVDEFQDVDTSGATPGEVLKYNGVEWVAGTDNAAGNVQTFTLSPSDVSNKYVDLSTPPSTPTATRLSISGAPGMAYSTDFEVITNGVDVRRLSWNGKTIDGILESGDVVTVEYD